MAPLFMAFFAAGAAAVTSFLLSSSSSSANNNNNENNPYRHHCRRRRGCTTTTTTITSTSTIRIDELLSTCVDACMRGCEEIRRVQSKRVGATNFQVDLKDVDDPKSALTEADTAAQHAVIQSLAVTWGPGLNIVGEEDGDDLMNVEEEGAGKYGPLRKDLISSSEEEEEEADCDEMLAPLSDITIFVDPLDGTREFVEVFIANCQTLVGVYRKGKGAVAGAMGIPFPAGDLSEDPSIVYGLYLPARKQVGVYGNPNTFRTNKKEQPEYEQHNVLLATGDAMAPVMAGVREVLAREINAKNILYGGAGNKILGAAFDEVDSTVQHKYGGAWDVCAPEALIRACGGRITDLFGNPLDRIYEDPRCSNYGYVGTSKNSRINHDDLCRILSECQAVQDYKDTVVK